jgi:hypothetical protein
VNFLCVLRLVPETRGHSLEEITGFWTSDRNAAAPEAAVVHQGGL